jgi:hypothetical protein
MGNVNTNETEKACSWVKFKRPVPWVILPPYNRRGSPAGIYGSFHTVYRSSQSSFLSKSFLLRNGQEGACAAPRQLVPITTHLDTYLGTYSVPP